MMRACLLTLGILAYLTLTACSTLHSADENKKEKTRISTAKINTTLGISYLEMNDVQRAKKKLLLALKQAPDIPEPWYSMGYYLETTGNKQEAKVYYSKAVAIAPKRGDVQNNFGTFLCRSGAYADSIQHFLLAVKDPDYLNTADAYENAGLCALKIPNQSLAAAYFKLAIQHDSNRPVSFVRLADINYKEGDMLSAQKNITHFSVLSAPTAESNMLLAKVTQKLMAQTAIAKNTYSIDNFSTAKKTVPIHMGHIAQKSNTTVTTKPVIMTAQPRHQSKKMLALSHPTPDHKTSILNKNSAQKNKLLAMNLQKKKKNVVTFHVYDKEKTTIVHTLYLS